MLKSVLSTVCLSLFFATAAHAAIYSTVTTRGVDDQAPDFDGIGQAATTNIATAGANRVGEVSFGGAAEGAMRRLIHVIPLDADAKADLIAAATITGSTIELPIRKQGIAGTPLAQVEVFFVTANALDADGNPINASTVNTDPNLIALYQAPAISILTTNFTVDNTTIERIVYDITAAFQAFLLAVNNVIPDNLAMRYQYVGGILAPDGDSPLVNDNWLINQGAGSATAVNLIDRERNSLVTTIIPEPASLALLALGGLGLLGRRRA